MKYLIAVVAGLVTLFAIVVGVHSQTAQAASVLFPSGGGTGTSFQGPAADKPSWRLIDMIRHSIERQPPRT